jgi:hypothetical protein
MTNRGFSIRGDQALGLLGLFLMMVVAKLADRDYAVQRTLAERVSGFVALRAIDGVAAIGWLVDRLPHSGGK